MNNLILNILLYTENAKYMHFKLLGTVCSNAESVSNETRSLR